MTATLGGPLDVWDGEETLIRRDELTGATIIIAIHSSRLGPATGGTRMRMYDSDEAALADAHRLAAGMTYKFAVAGFPRGGGKCVISVPAPLDTEARRGLLRRYGEWIHELAGVFCTGPDIGTSSTDMDVIAETGAPYVFSRTRDGGGAGGSGPFTALGVFTGIQTTCEHVFDGPVTGRRIMVQGVGAVGGALVERLLQAGADPCFAEVDEGLASRVHDELGVDRVKPEEAFQTACDLLAPCALGGVLNETSIPALRCQAVVGGANNQLATPEDAVRLAEHGVLYVPDFAVNAGGAVGITGMELLGWSRPEAERRVVEGVRDGLGRILRHSAETGRTPLEEALRLARERLAAGLPLQPDPSDHHGG